METDNTDDKQLISDTYVRGHISITVMLTRNSLYLIPKHVMSSIIICTHIRVGGCGWVPPTAAPFSFEMDVVLVGVALLCISLHPLIFMYAHANVCVRVSICLCACVCVCVGSDSQSKGLESTSLTCQIGGMLTAERSRSGSPFPV